MPKIPVHMDFMFCRCMAKIFAVWSFPGALNRFQISTIQFILLFSLLLYFFSLKKKRTVNKHLYLGTRTTWGHIKCNHLPAV